MLERHPTIKSEISASVCDIVGFFSFGPPLEHMSDLAFASFSYLHHTLSFW